MRARHADMISFGQHYIGNPDLVERLRHNAKLTAANKATYYGGGAAGYTDYKTLDEALIVGLGESPRPREPAMSKSNHIRNG
jgi:2,4-dienoyl-CoA reductase-like NADH-dependent reductase (Old Yellow Enzyme family)